MLIELSLTCSKSLRSCFRLYVTNLQIEVFHIKYFANTVDGGSDCRSVLFLGVLALRKVGRRDGRHEATFCPPKYCAIVLPELKETNPERCWSCHIRLSGTCSPLISVTTSMKTSYPKLSTAIIFEYGNRAPN